MDELLPCPFCGSRDVRYMRYVDISSGLSTGLVVAVCIDCKVQGPPAEELYLSDDAWNRRAPVKTETTEDARTKERVTR